jgi:hypothetical protein
MAALWLVQEVIMIFMYYDLPSISEQNLENDNDNDEKKPLLPNSSIQANETNTKINGTVTKDVTHGQNTGRMNNAGSMNNVDDSLKAITDGNSIPRERSSSSLSEHIALAKGRYFKYFNLLFYNRPSHHSLQ